MSLVSEQNGTGASETHEPVDIREYLRPIWSRRWLVFGIVALLTVGAYFYEKSRPKEYEASTAVYITSSDVNQALFGTTDQTDPDRRAQNDATLIKSRTNADAVARRIGYKGDPAALAGDVSVTPVSGEDFVRITATQPSGPEAARLANAFATAFIGLRSAALRSQTEAALKVARTQLAQLGTGPGTGSAQRTLRAKIRQLEVIRALPTVVAEQIDKALSPSTPARPKPKRTAIFAFVMSILIAIGVALGLERIDRRLKRIQDVETTYGVPLLAVVPHDSTVAPTLNGEAILAEPFKESFRTLRTNLNLQTLDRPLRRILVTSAVAGEGKSTVVRNLAVAFRESGLGVAVIEADLRKPSLTRLFLVEARPGLTDVLSGAETLNGALQTVAVHQAAATAFARVLGDGTKANGSPLDPREEAASLVVLAAGPKPPNPPAVLAAERFRSLVDEVAADFEIVIIDSPPLLAVSDSIPLLSQVDGVILVGRLEQTTRDQGRRLRALVNRVPDARVAGVVANDAPRGVFEYAGYTYYGEPSET